MNEDRTQYIANMLAQMARMIPARDRPLLVYLIEMAAMEARDGPQLSGGKSSSPSSGKGR